MYGDDTMIHMITDRSQSTVKWATAELIRQASQYNSVLEIGCGDGHVIRQIKAKDRFGIDACDGAIKKAKKDSPTSVKYYRFDLHLSIEGKRPLPYVDCIIGMDIIEHFLFVDAQKLLEVCEQSCDKCLMFFVPVGNHPQTKDDRGYGNDYYQTHRSTWHPGHMESLGYEVWVYPDWHPRHKLPKEKGAMWCRKLLE
jgi:2-polyprenyl-3-methyl-5-hydroxy-6-metoxy-1,4-benzoquinol methylase